MLTTGVQGLVHCDAFTAMGHVSVYGRNFTFDNFDEEDGLYNVSQAQGGNPIQDPMFGALYTLLDGSESSEITSAQVIDVLGFAEVEGDANSPMYVPPSMDTPADALWRGATHMAVAVALLSRNDSVEYRGIEHVPVSGRTRDWPIFIVAMSLLAVWLFSIIGSAVVLWRGTSLGPAFYSYVAARLLAQRADLVEGNSLETLEDNDRMLEKFVVAWDSSTSSEILH